MENEEIFQKAMKIAEKNGYDSVYLRHYYYRIDFDKVEDYGGYIFSHDFAKAFWGEGKRLHWLYDWYEIRFGLYSTDPKWKYHLSEMVKYENPLKYIEMFFEEGNPLWSKWLQNNKTKKKEYV